MATKKQAEKAPESKELVAPAAAGLPVSAELFSSMEADAKNASGFDNVGMEDCAVPFLSILQALSPKLQGKGAIEGAKAGDLYNNVTCEVYKGPLEIITCAFQHSWVEWKVREAGGGFVAKHETDALVSTTKKDALNRDILPNGNQLVDTAHHFVMLLNADGGFARMVVAFTGSQIKKSRRWNSQAMSQQVKIPETGKVIRPPRYAMSYTVTTTDESNAKGNWKGWVIEKPKLLTNLDIYGAAKMFYEEVTKGLVKVTAPEAEPEETVGDPAKSQVM